MVVLDLGCGNAKEKGAIGYDLIDFPCVDIVQDLNKNPKLKNDANSVDKILMKDFIEHLTDPIGLIKECHRVLKPQGILYITTVHWTHRYSYSDPQHVRAFEDVWFKFLVGQERSWYYDFAFSKLEIEYFYDSRSIEKFIGSNIPNDKLTIDQKKVLHDIAYNMVNVIQAMFITLTK